MNALHCSIFPDGGRPLAAAPDEAAFAPAGIWRLTVPPGALAGLNDVYLEINYVGDVGRLHAGGRLLDDNFYNGTPWEIGLKRLGPALPAQGLDLQILPLRHDAPIFPPQSSRPDFGGQSEIAGVASVRAIPEYEVTWSVQPETKPR